MENMKSLADQIRQQLGKPEPPNGKTTAVKPENKAKTREKIPPILTAILEYDNTANKSMVHVRFDEKTVRTMNQFKMATGVDVTRLVSFSVKHLLETNPDIKTIIKQFIQNTDL
jgi:DNA-binding phage protein